MPAAVTPDVVTLTMNPALDIATVTDRIVPIDKLRCGEPRRDPGGGGINVARMLTNLGVPVTAVYPSGGHTGRALEDLLSSEDVPMRIVTVRGSTRESFTVRERSTGRQYRFVLPGAALTSDEVAACLDALRSRAGCARYVVASGSLPPGVPIDFYQTVADTVTGAGGRLVLDTSGPALQAVRSGVHILKPSIRELREYAGRELRTTVEQAAAARALVNDGVTDCVALSLGADGALWVTANEVEHVPGIEVPVVSSVGAGDSLVAGTVFGLVRGQQFGDALRCGVAAATATLGSPGTGLGTRDDVERYCSLLCAGG